MKGSAFIAGLKEHFQRIAPVLKNAEMDYVRWIKRLSVQEDELGQIYDSLLESCKYFPSIAELTAELNEKRRNEFRPDQIIQAFNVKGLCYVLCHKTGKTDKHTGKPIVTLTHINPSNPVPIQDAKDIHAVIPPELQAHFDPCDKETARNWFMFGWRQSGADIGKCEAMFNLVVKTHEREEVLSAG